MTHDGWGVPPDLDSWHCSALGRRGAVRVPCDRLAIVIFVRPDGVKVGYCDEDRRAGQVEADARGWTQLQIDQAAAA